MKKKRLSVKVVLSLVLSAVLFTMPAVAFAMNGNYAVKVLAENAEEESGTESFDTTKPTLNAAVSDGLLSIQVYDTDSGAKAVYVNGYEFTDLTNGTLNIRLQQFDAGYEYFTIYAMDNAGNMSEVYKTANPYYTDPDSEDSGEDASGELPVSAEATDPGSATATVTEHTVTDSDGNTTSQTSAEEQKKQAFAEADAAEAAESENEEDGDSGQGKEFYTIQTASDKVFYLIIDRDGDEEVVYFLTEITENDLLNTTSDNSETLPKNSAALESAIPVSESALSNNNADQESEAEENAGGEMTEASEEESTEEAGPEEEPAKEGSPMVSYILLGVLAAAFVGGAYYFKVVRRKKEDFIEDEDEDEEDAEEYENEDEDEETQDSGDGFFEDEEDE